MRDLKALWQLYRFFRTERPEIVHSHTPKAGTLGMIAARLANVPHRLHTVAGLPLLEARGKKRRLLDWVEKLTYTCATKVYPNSFGLKDIILQNGYTTARKIKVLAKGSSNGIDTHFFSADNLPQSNDVLRTKLSLQESDFVFIFVGRITGAKGVNELIHAFGNIASEHAQVKLLLLGKFEKELDPIQEATYSEIENNPAIHYVGYQNDVRPYFAISHALVFPSYREGFPNVVMQAGAMGLPSIVTDINGCNEIIIEGKNGTIIPPKDAEQLEKAMRRYIEDSAYVQGLAGASRHLIVSRFEQQAVWNALLAEYRSLENEKIAR